MELRVFPRDQHLDIMNEFLKDGEFQSIPTLVFYTKDLRYIGHWIERAKKANDEMPIMRDIYAGRTREEAADDIRAFQRAVPCGRLAPGANRRVDRPGGREEPVDDGVLRHGITDRRARPARGRWVGSVIARPMPWRGRRAQAVRNSHRTPARSKAANEEQARLLLVVVGAVGASPG
ncbi:MAG: thioredoxin family protein [Dehalococcoidia bacterium]